MDFWYVTPMEKLQSVKRDVCGSEAGYKRHKYYKEEKCQECRDAHNVYRRDHYTTEAGRRYTKNYKNRKKLERAEVKAEKLSRKANKALEIKQAKEEELAEYLAIKERVRAFNKIIVTITLPPINLRKATPRQRHEIRQILLKRDGMGCYLCGIPVDFKGSYIQGQEGWEHYPHLEHVIPVSKGGSDELENIKLAHAICNVRKGVQIL